MAALQRAQEAMDCCIQSRYVPRGERPRAEAGGLWGAVTDYRILRGVVVGYRLKLDRGDSDWFWAAAVTLGPAPAGRPHLVALPGGRA